MSDRKKFQRCYLLSAVMLTIFSSTFLLMPLSNSVSAEYARMVMVINGTIFWISCILGYGLLLLAYRLNKKTSTESIPKRKIYLFANMPTKIANISFVVGVLLLAILIKQNMSTSYGVYVVLFIMVLAFNMHLLFSRGLYKKIKDTTRNYKEEKQ